MLSKSKWAVYAIASLSVCSTLTIAQSIRAENTITTVTSINNAPYSQVFYTGSVYAVRDHDFKGSEPKIGVSTLWSKNPVNNELSLSVRYCLPVTSLVGLNASLTKLVLLNNNQPLVTIEQPVKAIPSYQRVVQSASVEPELGFWDSNPYWGDDAFWDGIPTPFLSEAITIPPLNCIAGSSRFDLTPLTSALTQLPDQTLQITLIFSNDTSSQWQLGQKTVQALKEMLAVRGTPANPSQSP